MWIRRHRPCGHTPTGQLLALSLPILFLSHRNVSSFLRHTALFHVSMSSPVSFLTPRIPFPPTKIHLSLPGTLQRSLLGSLPPLGCSCLLLLIAHDAPRCHCFLSASLREPSLPAESSAELLKVQISGQGIGAWQGDLPTSRAR